MYVYTHPKRLKFIATAVVHLEGGGGREGGGEEGGRGWAQTGNLPPPP